MMGKVGRLRYGACQKQVSSWPTGGRTGDGQARKLYPYARQGGRHTKSRPGLDGQLLRQRTHSGASQAEGTMFAQGPATSQICSKCVRNWRARAAPSEPGLPSSIAVAAGTKVAALGIAYQIRGGIVGVHRIGYRAELEHKWAAAGPCAAAANPVAGAGRFLQQHPHLLVMAQRGEAAQGRLYRRRIEQARIQGAAVDAQLAPDCAISAVLARVAAMASSTAIGPSRRRCRSLLPGNGRNPARPKNACAAGTTRTRSCGHWRWRAASSKASSSARPTPWPRQAGTTPKRPTRWSGSNARRPAGGHRGRAPVHAG